MTEIKLNAEDIDRFWVKVRKASTNECWNWRAGLFRGGYGQFRLGRLGAFKRVKAHRVAWFLANGESPRSQLVCHSCDNPQCCNPAHLWLGDQNDNTQDKIAKGRARYSRGSKLPQTILTEQLVKQIKQELQHDYRGLGQELAARFGVTPGTISAIKRGKTWRHINA